MNIQEEVLIKILSHFTIKNRGIDGERCVYYNPETGTRCGVGMFLREGEWQMERGSVYALGKWSNCFQPAYQGISNEFWIWVQTLHDMEENWNGAGVTLKGLECVRDICDNFNLDFERVANEVMSSIKEPVTI